MHIAIKASGIQQEEDTDWESEEGEEESSGLPASGQNAISCRALGLPHLTYIKSCFARLAEIATFIH
jgi:hypothetical protein